MAFVAVIVGIGVVIVGVIVVIVDIVVVISIHVVGDLQDIRLLESELQTADCMTATRVYL